MSTPTPPIEGITMAKTKEEMWEHMKCWVLANRELSEQQNALAFYATSYAIKWIPSHIDDTLYDMVLKALEGYKNIHERSWSEVVDFAELVIKSQ